MTNKGEDEMTTLFDQSDRAFERLYMRSSHTFGPLTAPPTPCKDKYTSKTPREKTKKAGEHVDIEKLSKLTGALHKSRESPSSLVDYSEFAEKNFDPHGVFTMPTKKGRSSSVRAKDLYNEVQRSSLNFGVTSEEMKSYHKRKVSALTDYSVQQSPQFSKPQEQPPSPPDPEFEEKKLLGDLSTTDSQTLAAMAPDIPPVKKFMAPLLPKKPQHHKQPRLQIDHHSPNNTPRILQRTGTSITVIPRRKSEKLPLDEATDVTKRQGVLLEPFESAHSQSKSNLLTPQGDFINTTSFNSSLELSDGSESDIAAEESPLIAEKEVSPFEDGPFSDKGVLTKKEDSSSRESTSSPRKQSRLTRYQPGSQSSLSRSTFGSLFRKKSQSSMTPTRKECHSVEDTLLADKEFNDFAIARRRRSSTYYPKSLEFSFEKPNSRGNSSRSSIVSRSPRPSPSEFTPTLARPHSLCTFSTSQSLPHTQRCSMYDSVSSVESSPVTPTRRLRGHVRGSNSMYSPSRAKSASLFDPIAEHKRVDHYQKQLQ